MLKGWRSTAIVTAITLVTFIVVPKLYDNQFLLFNMMMYMALAQGLNIIYGYTGYLPFGYVGFFGAGAYAGALVIIFLHWMPLIAVLVGGLTAVLFGMVLIPLFRLSGAYFSIASLAASEALYYVVANPHLEKITQGPYGISMPQAYDANAAYWTMLGILALSLVTSGIIRRSRFGLALSAIRENPLSASMSGVNVVQMRSLSWLLSAFIAGLAGATFGWYISVFYPETVFSLTIGVFTIVFILFGGIGTLIGPIIGTLILYGLYNYIGISTPQYFQIAYGLLIVLLVLFLPNGLVSLLKRRGVDVP
ncbi:branched-chain amino acid ABC transporter permease [Oleiagrimonas sp.]|uniref:branched-chain amino acid ABC transporter permease n=1 Tax=Oleiagrimonas sp. TaxID=2010330 RepID=UPI00260B05DC|nr:branched-chain amino acid ABC transporter permease [Oleiagrimonas sp.]MDA3912983.1 branched-chain amino acid ABC transporter permease [Oleiagrimonas sp.]